MVTAVESLSLRHADVIAPDAASVSEDKHESVDKMRNKLEKIVSGLGSVQNAQKNTQFAKMITPYVEKMAKVLDEVHNSSSLSEKEKREKLEHAEDSMNNLANDMASFGQHLIDDQTSEQTSILLGILLSRKNESMDRQMEVLTDKQFEHLDCAKYVLTHKTDSPLVEQVAAYLDSQKKPPEPRVPTAPIPTLQAITETKPTESHKAEPANEIDYLKAMNLAVGAIHTFQHDAPEEKENMQLNKLTNVLTKAIETWKAKAKNAKEEGDSDAEKAVAAHVVESLSKARVDLLKAEVRHLKNVRALLKSGDVQGMQEALDQSHQLRGILDQVFDELQHSGLVHGKKQALLQFNSFAHSFSEDCPYCKAQCIEKCHNAGHSFAQCLGTCAEEGEEKQEKDSKKDST